MDKPSQEDLLGYVLGAMDAPEARNIQALIDQHPELDDELLQIKNSLLPLDQIDNGGPRPGLARRTCEWVAASEQDHRAAALEAATGATSPMSAASLAVTPLEIPAPLTDANIPPRTSWWSSVSVPNFLFTAAAIAIAASILFPAIAHTRHNSRLIACRNNLQQLGRAFMKYSDLNAGQFVSIPQSGKLATNGGFGPILKNSGLLEDDSLLACAGVAESKPVHIPTIEQLEAASGNNLVSLQKRTGGHFGYSMGYHENGTYRAPHNAGRSNVVLLADAPSIELVGRRSGNHGGHGQNVLFEDGRVQFIGGHAIAGDAIYENDYGIVAPGSHPADSVIAPNHLAPRGASIEFISMP